MVVRAVVCPSPPFLAADLTGRATVAPDLAKACAEAVGRLLAGRPETVTVVAGGPATAAWDPCGRLDLAAYGPGLGEGTAGLPLGLGIGAMLLEAAGYAGRRELRAVDDGAPPAECLRLGASLAAGPGRTGLLVVADGTARRDPKAPGHLDERAAPFDAEVERALREGDMAALAGLDPHLARELMAGGRAAWQVLAGALSAGEEEAPGGDILYSGAPFGVCYLVAVL